MYNDIQPLVLNGQDTFLLGFDTIKTTTALRVRGSNTRNVCEKNRQKDHIMF